MKLTREISMPLPFGIPDVYLKIFLGVFWLGMQVVFFYGNGIVTDLEATKYIYEAQQFLQTGHYSSGKFLFYSVQIFLIAACLKWHLSFLFIVIFQMVMNGLSAICFFKLAKKFTNLTYAYGATFFFLVFFYYHLFNTFLFTESLFFSFSIIYSWALFSTKKFTVVRALMLCAFVVLLYFTRPVGLFFIAATIVYLLIRFYSKKLLLISMAAIAAAVAILFYLTNYSLASGGEFDFLLPYQNEMIICGVSSISDAHSIKVPVEKNSIQGLWYVITHYPDLFFRLASHRLIAFFGIYRPYYSWFHNLFACGYFLIMYAAIIAGARRLFEKYKPEVWFMLVMILLTAATVMLSCDEWSNRFIFAVMPFLLLLATHSLHQFSSVKPTGSN